MSPLVVTSLARAENSGGGRQENAQALTPVEAMWKRIIVESFCCVSSYPYSGGRREQVDGLLKGMRKEQVRNADLDSNIDLHPMTPHGIPQLSAHPCNSTRPNVGDRSGGRGGHYRCPVQSQPSVTIGKALEFRV